jgi:hypothetical protein
MRARVAESALNQTLGLIVYYREAGIPSRRLEA